MLTTSKATIDQKTLSSSRTEQNTNISTTIMETPKSLNTIPRRHKLGYFSSYDRGLDILLKLWPNIIIKYPDTTLDICYGWDLFDKGYRDNPERMNWKDRMNKLMEQQGITHHGRVSKQDLGKIRQACGIWAYPTYFAEINCITALECQKDGLVPVTMNSFALKETVGAGSKVDGDIYDSETQKAWLEALYQYMDDEKLWNKERKKAQDFAKSYSWDDIAQQWAKLFI